MVDMIGWSSAAVLLATISAQIAKQHRERSIEGVSPWLYVGQGTASTGLLVYSVLTHAWVFTLLNAAMIAAAIYGMALWLHLRRHETASAAH